MATEVGSATEFELDHTITVPGSAASLTLSGATDAAVLRSIAEDNAFPDGALSLGRIEFGAKTNDISFDAGSTKVSFGASVNARLSGGVFTSATSAVTALQLADAAFLDLSLPASASDRFFMLVSGYEASGHVEGTHPLGVLGSATFGVEAARASVFAVIHRFDAAEAKAARTVIADTVKSWRLPRQVATDATGAINLKPATWIVAETDGSLAVKLAATLGYDISFAKEAKILGLTENLGVKVDASLKATVGLSVSGRYLLVVGREDSSSAPGTTVRVRLHKLSKKGLDIGLNLDVGVTASLPTNFKTPDDLVKAIFGQHGLQVLKEIEHWADPNTPMADNLAQLAHDKGLELIEKTTGINVESRFNEGRALVLGALTQWDALPERVSTFLWGHLGLGGTQQAELKTFLEALSNPDPEKRAKAFAKAITNEVFGDSPVAGFLQAAAERGLLVLSLEDASRVAAEALEVLNGGVLEKLHDFIEEKLNLELIRNGDFTKVDSWLVARLAAFLNKTALGSPELKEIQTAIAALDTKAREIYAKGIEAATKRYSATFAATYQRTTAKTALLDVTFDMSEQAARNVFRDVLAGHLDGLLIGQVAGVSIGKAAISHSIERTSDIALHLPFGGFGTTHINLAIASLAVEEHAGRVLVYDVQGDDKITKARYLSDLSLLASVRVAQGRATLDSGVIAYESLQTQRSMRGDDLESRTEPFIGEYFPRMFGGGDAALPTFYSDLDATVGGSSNRFGDVALSMQVAYPASVLTGWLRPRSQSERRADAAAISRRLQKTIRRLVADAFFQDLDKFEDNEVTAALLVWSCLPVTTAVDFDGRTITRFDKDDEPFWDFASFDLRQAMAQHSLTVARLALALDDAQKRLSESNRPIANRFGHSRAGHMIAMAIDSQGHQNLRTLLITENTIVKSAQSALEAISNASADLATAPTRAIEELADFAATLTNTFNDKLSNLYGTRALRTLGPLVLAEASAALSPGLAEEARAMLRLYFLKNAHTFSLDSFTKSELPPSAEVRLVQTLASA